MGENESTAGGLTPEEQQPVQPEFESVAHSPEEPYTPPVPKCRRCGQREIDYSASSRSSLCTECRQLHLKLSIPTKVKLFLVAVCAVFVLSMLTLPASLASYRTYVNADRHMKAREYVSAYNSYSSLLDRYGDSVPLVLKTADAAMNAQYFYELAFTVDTYLAGRNVTDSEYYRAMKYVNFLDRYFETIDKVDAITAQLSAELGDADPAEFAGRLREELTSLIDNGGTTTDRSLVYFYLGLTSADGEEAAHYFNVASSPNNGVYYPCAYEGNVLRRLGRNDEAENIYRYALAANAEDAFAMRGLSIIELLGGDAQASYDTMLRAFEINPYGTYMADSMLIAMRESDRHDAAEALLERLLSEGFVIEADLRSYLDGNLTATEYYMQ